MWDDLICQGLVPAQRTVGEALEGGSEISAAGRGTAQVVDYGEKYVTGAAVKSKDSADREEEGEQSEPKEVIVRDFAVEAEVRS